MLTSSLTFPGDLFADFDELQRQFERVFAMRGNTNSSIRSVGRGSFPAVNIGSTPEAVEIYVFAPGVDPAALEVSVDKGLLTIAGERKTALADRSASNGNGNGANGNNKQTVYSHERHSGSFRRVISLPEDADANRVDASYTHGVLKVRVEKREASRPRRIEITEAR